MRPLPKLLSLVLTNHRFLTKWKLKCPVTAALIFTSEGPQHTSLYFHRPKLPRRDWPPPHNSLILAYSCENEIRARRKQ